MVYEWRSGSRIKGDPSVIGREVSSLGSAIEAKSIVDKARDENTALHACFEWDNTVAGEEYRLSQAREIIRALVIYVDKRDEPEGTTRIRAYEHVDLGENADPRRAYVPTKKVLKDPELRSQVIARLNSDIQEAECTAKKYEYLSSQFGEVHRRLHHARCALSS
jgi:hypothetical protein